MQRYRESVRILASSAEGWRRATYRSLDLATPYTPSLHLLKMQVQGSNISRQEDAFEFKLLQQFGLIPRAPPGQGLTRSPVEGGVNYS